MIVRAVVLACVLAGAKGMEPTDVDALSLLQTRAEMLRPHKHAHAKVQSHGKPAPFVLRRESHFSNGGSGMVRLLDFSKATIVYNNLGGQGPQKGDPEEIRYRNLVQGQQVDLVVTAGAGYQLHNSKRNGILGGNGQINAKSGSSVSLTFTFVQQGTNVPHPLAKFYMTFSDIDERHGGVENETISVDGFSKYYTNDDLKIVDDGNEYPTFQSSDFGDYSDNEFSPDSPEPTQLSHAVTYLFLNKATFHAVFSIESPRNMKKGRNVLFSGISQLVFCQEPSTYLDFKNSTVTANNLGGYGPLYDGAQELRYSGIATFNNQLLDLVVTADTAYGYTPSNSSKNGLHGEFGKINLHDGPTTTASEAYVTFTMVRSGTLEPIVVDQFAFVVFDFDSGLHEQQVEYIEIGGNQPGFEGGTGYASYIVTASTEVAVVDAPRGQKRFKATKHGTEADNPKTSQMLAREVSDKSVVFTFRQASHFKMTLGITPTDHGGSGRNFMFSGQDMYLMCD